MKMVVVRERTCACPDTPMPEHSTISKRMPFSVRANACRRMPRSCPGRLGRRSRLDIAAHDRALGDSYMTTLLITVLAAICLYLAKRLSDANAANTTLRDQVASLKRQLVRHRNGARASA